MIVIFFSKIFIGYFLCICVNKWEKESLKKTYLFQGRGETGEFLCKHAGVSKVTFTGSISTGQKITKTCADTMKKITMELGGKSALIVFSDCDLKNAVKATLMGNFLTQGEVSSLIFFPSEIILLKQHNIKTSLNNP